MFFQFLFFSNSETCRLLFSSDRLQSPYSMTVVPHHQVMSITALKPPISLTNPVTFQEISTSIEIRCEEELCVQNSNSNFEFYSNLQIRAACAIDDKRLIIVSSNFNSNLHLNSNLHVRDIPISSQIHISHWPCTSISRLNSNYSVKLYLSKVNANSNSNDIYVAANVNSNSSILVENSTSNSIIILAVLPLKHISNSSINTKYQLNGNGMLDHLAPEIQRFLQTREMTKQDLTIDGEQCLILWNDGDVVDNFTLGVGCEATLVCLGTGRTLRQWSQVVGKF